MGARGAFGIAVDIFFFSHPLPDMFRREGEGHPLGLERMRKGWLFVSHGVEAV